MRVALTLFRRSALALVLAATISSRAPAADELYQKLGPLFVTLVHRDSTLGAPTRRLSRWTEPLHVVLAGRRFDTWEPRVRNFLAELSAATGTSISLSGEPPHHVAVLFADGFVADSERIPAYKALLQHAIRDPAFVEAMASADRTQNPCVSLIYHVGDALDGALLLVAERAPQRRQEFCVFSFLVRMTGLGVWDLNVRTIAEFVLAEPSPGHAALTKEGRQLLQMLYHSRLRAGMKVNETLPLLRPIVEGLP